MSKCIGVTKKGQPCRYNAKNGQYCGTHYKVYAKGNQEIVQRKGQSQIQPKVYRTKDVKFLTKPQLYKFLLTNKVELSLTTSPLTTSPLTTSEQTTSEQTNFNINLWNSNYMEMVNDPTLSISKCVTLGSTGDGVYKEYERIYHVRSNNGDIIAIKLKYNYQKILMERQDYISDILDKWIVYYQVHNVVGEWPPIKSIFTPSLKSTIYYDINGNVTNTL